MVYDQAKKDLQALVEALPQSERDILFKSKQHLKDKAKASTNIQPVRDTIPASTEDGRAEGSRQATPINGEV
jgi:hypothetical protein